MYMNVNKKTTIVRRPVKYAALSSGTISHVWYDEDSSAKQGQKRQNRIMLKRERNESAPRDNFDA